MYSESGAMTPHFIGLFVASLGLLLLSIWLRRKKTAEGLRSRSGTITVLYMVLVLLPAFLFGSGSTTTYLRGSIVVDNEPGLDEALSAAMEVALSDAFLSYHWSLISAEPTFDGESLKALLSLRVESHKTHTAEVTQLHYEFTEQTNLGVALLGCGRQARSDRFEFAKGLGPDYMRGLLALALYRQARTDPHRISALNQILGGIPMNAEWLVRELALLKGEEPARAVIKQIDQITAWVQLYIDDPTMRSLPEGTRVELAD